MEERISYICPVKQGQRFSHDCHNLQLWTGIRTFNTNSWRASSFMAIWNWGTNHILSTPIHAHQCDWVDLNQMQQHHRHGSSIKALHTCWISCTQSSCIHSKPVPGHCFLMKDTSCIQWTELHSKAGLESIWQQLPENPVRPHSIHPYLHILRPEGVCNSKISVTQNTIDHVCNSTHDNCT